MLALPDGFLVSAPDRPGGPRDDPASGSTSARTLGADGTMAVGTWSSGFDGWGGSACTGAGGDRRGRFAVGGDGARPSRACFGGAG